VTQFDLANNNGPPYGRRGDETSAVSCSARTCAVPRELVISTRQAGYELWPGPYGGVGLAQVVTPRLARPEPRAAWGWTTWDVFYFRRVRPAGPRSEGDDVVRPSRLAVSSGRALVRGQSRRTRRSGPSRPQRCCGARACACSYPSPRNSMLNRGWEGVLLGHFARGRAGSASSSAPRPGKALRQVPRRPSPRGRGRFARVVARPVAVHRPGKNLGHIAALAGSALARGQSLAQWSLAWTLRDPRSPATLVGVRAASAAWRRNLARALEKPCASTTRAPGRDSTGTPSRAANQPSGSGQHDLTHDGVVRPPSSTTSAREPAGRHVRQAAAASCPGRRDAAGRPGSARSPSRAEPRAGSVPCSAVWAVHARSRPSSGVGRAGRCSPAGDRTRSPRRVPSTTPEYRSGPLGRMQRTKPLLTRTTYGPASRRGRGRRVRRAHRAGARAGARRPEPYRADDPHMMLGPRRARRVHAAGGQAVPAARVGRGPRTCGTSARTAEQLGVGDPPTTQASLAATSRRSVRSWLRTRRRSASSASSWRRRCRCACSGCTRWSPAPGWTCSSRGTLDLLGLPDRPGPLRALDAATCRVLLAGLREVLGRRRRGAGRPGAGGAGRVSRAGPGRGRSRPGPRPGRCPRRRPSRRRRRRAGGRRLT
jgi:hypothetical protein